MKKLGCSLAIVGVGFMISACYVEGSVVSAASYSDMASAKIDHLIWSMKNNYLGIKNQAQWEIYIVEARELIKRIPSSQSGKKQELTDKVNMAEKLVQAVARVNHVEKSMDINYHGIKNATTWRSYLDLGREYLSRVDRGVFDKEYNNILDRLNFAESVVLGIEKEFESDYDTAHSLYLKACRDMTPTSVTKAIEAAKSLGTCTLSDELESKCYEIQSYVRNMNIEIESICLVNKSYDDDRVSQSLDLLVNGHPVGLEFLRVIGCSVSFTIEDITGTRLPLFLDGIESRSGKLKSPLPIGEYTGKVSLSRGSKVINSTASVNIFNLDSAVTSIKGAGIKNLGDDITSIDDDFIQLSSTLVKGESSRIGYIDVISDGKEARIYDGIKVSSNNSDVAYVDSTGIIHAESPGEAILTVSYNGINYPVKIRVCEGGRIASSITSKPSVSAIVNRDNVITLGIRDQYGDPSIEEVSLSIQDSNSSIGDAMFSYGLAYGEGTINYKTLNRYGTSMIHVRNSLSKIIGSIEVNVSNIDDISRYSVDIVNGLDDEYSSDLNIYNSSYYKDKLIDMQISMFNSQGIYSGKYNLNGCRVMYDDKTLNITNQVNGTFEDVSSFSVSGIGDGESDIVILDRVGSVLARTRVKVISESNSIKAVKWNDVNNINYAGETINIYDALNITETSGDDIVNGITLGSTTNNRVRIKKSQYRSGIDSGTLYIDSDGNGKYTNGDIVIGLVECKVLDKGTGESEFVDIFSGYTTKHGDSGFSIFYLREYNSSTGSVGNIIDNKIMEFNI